ncbi:DUF4293 family protein [bacterium]|nr:DUF4293 family protein [bacterium]
MIQRIQSVYLLISAIATALIFVFPLYTAHFQGTELVVDFAQAKLMTEGAVVDSEGNLYIGMIAGLTAAFSLGIIFLFNNRLLQIKMARLASLLHTVLLVSIMFLAVDAAKAMPSVQALAGGEEVGGQYGIASFLPIVGMVLCFLASRAIMSDEAKVRSANRLR